MPIHAAACMIAGLHPAPSLSITVKGAAANPCRPTHIANGALRGRQAGRAASLGRGAGDGNGPRRDPSPKRPCNGTAAWPHGPSRPAQQRWFRGRHGPGDGGLRSETAQRAARSDVEDCEGGASVDGKNRFSNPRELAEAASDPARRPDWMQPGLDADRHRTAEAPTFSIGCESPNRRRVATSGRSRLALAR